MYPLIIVSVAPLLLFLYHGVSILLLLFPIGVAPLLLFLCPCGPHISILWPLKLLYIEGRFCHLYHPIIVHIFNVKEVSPSKRLISKSRSIFSSILWAGCITFGIKALDYRVLLLQTCHCGIFAIMFSIRRWRSWKFYRAKPKFWETSCKKFRSLFAKFLEILSVEVRNFLGSQISSQIGDRGKIVITLSPSYDWNSIKCGRNYT